MANDKKKTLEGVLSEQAKNEATSGAILDLYGELNYLARTHGKVSTIPLSDFLVNNKGKLTPATVKKTLESLKPYPNATPLDERAVLRELIAHYKDIAKFLENYATPTTLLFLNEYGKIPDKNTNTFKALEACYERIKFEQTHIVDDDGNDFTTLVYDDTKTGNTVWHASINNVSQADDGEYYGWLLRADKGKVLELIDKLPKDNKSYSLGFASGEQSNFMLEVAKLLIDLGISPLNGDSTTDPAYSLFDDEDGNKTVAYYSAMVAFTYVIDLVSHLYEKKLEKDSEHRTIVNIKDAEKHAVILQPHTLGLTDMIDGAFENRDLNNLYGNFRREGYKNNDEIKQKGEWLAHIDPKQGELPIDYGEKDQKTLVKFMTQVKALVLDTAIALWLYRQENPERKPDEWVKLIDLARYIERFNDKKLREKNELRPENKSQLLLGLQLAQLVGVDYRVNKDKRGNFEWRRVFLIDRITEFKTYGNTDSIIAVKVNFTKEYLESGGLNIGVILDGVQRLKTSEHKALGAYILERFAQYQASTIQGKPLKATTDTLIKKAGIIDSNTTNKLKTLQEALDQLVEISIIAKWTTKNGKHNIRGYDKESQTILIYPTDNLVNGYTTKPQAQAEKHAIKLEQQNRQRKLKTWFKGYTDRTVASKELGVSVAELNEMLAGKKIINDDIIDTIESEV
jgi:hypothetical protein